MPQPLLPRDMANQLRLKYFCSSSLDLPRPEFTAPKQEQHPPPQNLQKRPVGIQFDLKYFGLSCCRFRLDKCHHHLKIRQDQFANWSQVEVARQCLHLKLSRVRPTPAQWSRQSATPASSVTPSSLTSENCMPSLALTFFITAVELEEGIARPGLACINIAKPPPARQI
ncbi:hypothetical protein QAD02_020041 [Eretmocerus hayati]|uniref:Uncharacterized protein n=1 Tax=Eretmocerus hayati TaxID=131215 RepID=A0ACC2PL12_9HYME|nr:hypothetical protein QAD02_020041 [Eretmocerus hayati]